MVDNVAARQSLLGAIERQEDIFITLADAIEGAYCTRQPLLVDNAGLVPLSCPPFQLVERIFISTPKGIRLHEATLMSAEYAQALDGSRYMMETLVERQGFIGLLLSGPDGGALYRSLSARDRSRFHRVCDWRELRGILDDIYLTFGQIPDEQVLGYVQELRMRASAVAAVTPRPGGGPRVMGLLVIGSAVCLGVISLLGVEGDVQGQKGEQRRK
ncbi:MAG: hypothetical protein HYT76_02165 [Deltaproteobacteria bacterium]|nr:hypothetical protein [Deltaproteobacteria bacterium]